MHGESPHNIAVPTAAEQTVQCSNRLSCSAADRISVCQHFCKVLGLILLVRPPVGPLLEVWRMRDLPDPGTVSVHRVQILLAQVLNVATEQDPGPIGRPG